MSAPTYRICVARFNDGWRVAQLDGIGDDWTLVSIIPGHLEPVWMVEV